MPRNTKAIIHLDAIKANYQLASRLAPQSKNIAVIKADAYGHGSIEVARVLESSVPAFGVAIIEEAITLREAGITKPILLLQGINTKAGLDIAADYNFWTMVENEVQTNLIAGTPLKSPLNIWLKLDTGMHRLGLNEATFFKVLKQLKDCHWVNDAMVLCSHLACASDIDSDMTEQQLQKFTQVSAELDLATSIANSAALMGFPETRLDWNRPGIMLYGLSPFDQPSAQDNLLEPAMTFTSTVIGIREIKKGESVGYGSIWHAEQQSTIATIAAGYADGYPRHAVNGTPLLIADQQAKLAGRVSMDMITADISNCRDIKIGDAVELWGKTINANDVARHAGTIGYDLITGVSQRVPREFS